MRKISADVVYPVSAPPMENAVVVVDVSGKILAIENKALHDPASVECHSGALIPGFVNTHCHLELSHMKGKVATGTGLIPFITNVVTQRAASAEIIADAIENAEREMLDGGIVALGDISNTTDTFPVKARGRMRFYTFVELFDFLKDETAEKTFAKWKAVYDQHIPTDGSEKVYTPHAPYSVSPTLFKLINAANPGGVTVSIHNQETPPEDEFFLHGRGDFYAFYGSFNNKLEHFRPNGRTAIHYALEHMDPRNRTLFVHNTLSTRDDIRAAQAWSPHTYWASCPNANLYIENRLPDYRAFIDTDARLTLGTDSLTSNWQLSILEEMKTIARFQSYVPFETMLRWATLNGAEALGFNDTLGSLEPGKIPGILLLQNTTPGNLINAETRVRRLV